MSSYRYSCPMGSHPSVSLIIPTLNEAKNLPLVLPYIPVDLVDEVILVDGRSTDHTMEIAQKILPYAMIVKETLPGKGAAIRRGFAESHGDILMVMDADGSHDPREIPRYIQALLDGADFVKGSRFTTLGGTTDMPRYRKLGNWAFTQMVNALFSLSFTDLCYGYMAFWRYTLDYVDLSTIDGFEIDASIYLQAVRNRLKVVDVPSFEGSRFYGTGKLQTFPDGWRVLRTILKEWSTHLMAPMRDHRIGFRGYNLAPAYALDAGPKPALAAPAPFHLAGALALNNLSQRMRLDEFFHACQHYFSDLDLQSLIPKMLLDIQESLGASSGALFLFCPDEANQTKCIYLAFGRKVESTSPDQVNDTLDNGIAGWVLQNHQPALIHSTRRDPRWLRRQWEDNEHVSRSVLAVPCMTDNILLAIIILARPDDREFTQRDLDRLAQYRVTL